MLTSQAILKYLGFVTQQDCYRSYWHLEKCSVKEDIEPSTEISLTSFPLELMLVQKSLLYLIRSVEK